MQLSLTLGLIWLQEIMIIDHSDSDAAKCSGMLIDFEFERLFHSFSLGPISPKISLQLIKVGVVFKNGEQGETHHEKQQ